MANKAGKQSAITTISPMNRWETFKLRCVFFLRKLKLMGGEARKLKQLSFIHFARWAIVRRDQFPKLDAAQPTEELQSDYLFFCSNFNGTWEQYIDAFSEVVTFGMDRIWAGSREFPGASPSTPFKQYIRHNQVDTDHYYSAYPGATTNDVKGALHLTEELQLFHQRTKDLAPDLFQQEYRKFLSVIAKDLGTSGTDGED